MRKTHLYPWKTTCVVIYVALIIRNVLYKRNSQRVLPVVVNSLVQQIRRNFLNFHRIKIFKTKYWTTCRVNMHLV